MPLPLLFEFPSQFVNHLAESLASCLKNFHPSMLFLEFCLEDFVPSPLGLQLFQIVEIGRVGLILQILRFPGP